MSNYITDGPFTPGNNSLICPNKQSQPTVSKNDETNVISYLQSLTNFCNEQLADRQEYLQIVNSNKTRATIFPCPYANFTIEQINERRKQEVLLHNSQQNKITKKEVWSKLSRSTKVNSHVCIGDVPSVTSNVPLYNYSSKTLPINTHTYQDLSFPYVSESINNVISNTQNPFFKLIFVNAPTLINKYDLSIPVSLNISGISEPSNTTSVIETTITHVVLNIYNTGTGQLQYAYVMNSNELSKMTILLQNQGYFESNLYLGNCTINSFQLTSCVQYNYSMTLEIITDAKQYNASGGISVNPINISSIAVSNVNNNVKTEINSQIVENAPYLSPLVFDVAS